jgi:hypothetical protein
MRISVVMFVVIVFAFTGLWILGTQASSHREAPLIASDPLADNTDVYVFVDPNEPDLVTFIANFIPLEFPSAGPNFHRFDDNVLYEVMIDNDGNAVEDITFQFRFQTSVRSPATFLYNTGPVTTLDDADLNVWQTGFVTRVAGPRRTGTAVELGSVPVMPANVGANSMPDYDEMIGSGVQQLPGGMRVFAGPRDEGFYLDLGAVFDLAQLRNLTGNFGSPVDGTAGFNVHTIAFQVPVEQLTRSGAQPSNTTDPDAVIGVWSTASRPSVTTRAPGGETHAGPWVQVSRLGNPLVNELVIDLARKDAFNGLEPTGDAVALDRVTDPEMARLLNALYGVSVPPPPRDDLVTIFLTGIPGLNQPTDVTASEMLRLNMAVPPSTGTAVSRLGLLGGDLAGYPNGRRVGDDVVDISLRVMAGATSFTPAFDVSPNNTLGDGVDANDLPYLDVIPYLASPHPGLDADGPIIK